MILRDALSPLSERNERFENPSLAALILRGRAAAVSKGRSDSVRRVAAQGMGERAPQDEGRKKRQ
jgi:hypothetical protein